MPVTTVRPVVAQYEPALHAKQAVAPVDAIKVPARQLKQLDEDAEGENVPDKQLEQSVEETTENEPAAQAPVTAVRPAVAQYDPPGQLVHEDIPVVAAKNPAWQFEHSVAEEAEYLPTGQVPVIALRPEVKQNVPPGQAKQDVEPADS